MPMRRPILVLVLLIAATMMALPSIPASAVAAPAPAPAPAAGEKDGAAPASPAAPAAKDAKAEALLKRVADFYKAARSGTVDVSTSMKVSGPGMKQEMNSNVALAVERPNKLALVEKAGGGGAAAGMTGTIVSDGKKMWVSVPMLKKYAEQDAPATLDEIIDSPASMVAQAAQPVIALFAADPYAQIMEDVRSVKHLGTKQIDGAAHEGVRLQQDQIDFDVWVAQGEKPLVRRIVPDMARQMQQAGGQNPQMKDMKMEASIDLSDWKLNAAIPPERFAFAAPQGAQKVASVMEIFGGGGGGGGGGEAHALKGKPAPDFSLDLLDAAGAGAGAAGSAGGAGGAGAGKATLAQHKGKDIVILDFWATWCGPCVRGLPIVTEVAKKYADKNVVFYAVNEQEDPEKIRPFLEQHKLDIKVALDKDAAVGNAYGVTGIPQTVIIGKDGIVKDVHVGFSPSLKAELTKELDQILAGGAAATTTKPAPRR